MSVDTVRKWMLQAGWLPCKFCHRILPTRAHLVEIISNKDREVIEDSGYCTYCNEWSHASS